jgi:hypothetical protein
MHLECLRAGVPELERHVLDRVSRIEQKPMGVEHAGEQHHHLGGRQAEPREPPFTGPPLELRPLGERGDRRSVAGRMQGHLQRLPERLGQLGERPAQLLHQPLRGALLQLGVQRAPERAGCVVEPVEQHPTDSRAPQVQEHAGCLGGERGVDHQRKRREVLPEAGDFNRARLAAQHGIDDRHLDGPRPNQGDDLDPTRGRNPFVALRFGGVEPEQAFARDSGQNRDLSQKRPSMSQKGPIPSRQLRPTWPRPLRSLSHRGLRHVSFPHACVRCRRCRGPDHHRLFFGPDRSQAQLHL